ncbi:MAG: hypothetical protein L0216_00245 [Planctomycetales bacterium]|nr:hypothetical protein [Planctomycetales bacterium]
MPIPEGFLPRFTDFLDRISREQKLARDGLERLLVQYPESVVVFLVASHERLGAPGFEGGFRLVDLLENLGVYDIVFPAPDRDDPVEVRLTRGDGESATLRVSRTALALDRMALVRLLKSQLGIERPTAETALMRRRPIEAEVRTLLEGKSAEAAAVGGSPDALPLPGSGGGLPPRTGPGPRGLTEVFRHLLTRRVGLEFQRWTFARPLEEAEGRRGRAAADRLADALEALGCQGFHIAEVEANRSLRVEGKRADGRPFSLRVARATLGLVDPDALRTTVSRLLDRAPAPEKARPAGKGPKGAKGSQPAREPGPAPPPAPSRPEAPAAAPGAALPPDRPDREGRLREVLRGLGALETVVTPIAGGRYVRVETTRGDGRRVAFAVTLATLDGDDEAVSAAVAGLLEKAPPAKG